jgi:tetratricopeptide (TPR) repeat protein
MSMMSRTKSKKKMLNIFQEFNMDIHKYLLLYYKTIYKLLLAILLLLLTSITTRGHNDLYYYIANPTLALVDVNPNQTVNENLTISTFYGIKSHSHFSYPWKQIESGVKASESTATSLPFRDPLNMPTDPGFKFELVSEEIQFKPHIHITVNNNNLPPASNGGKKIVSSNQMSATNVSASRGSNVTSYPSSTNSLLLPVANAGTNQTVNENSTVTLVGVAIDPNPSAKLSLSWRQIAGPFVKLDNSDTANPTFTSPSDLRSDTQLKFLLIAKDDRGAASRPAIVTITVKHVNLPPVANAGQNQVVNSGHVVSLDGSKSRDPDGSIAYYSWTQISGPAVRLEGVDTPTPTFTAPTVSADTVLKFWLAVKDDKGAISNNHSIVSVTVKATVQKSSIATAPSNATTANNATANNIGRLNNKGTALFYLGNYTEAIKYFDQALAIQPNDANALGGKGKSLEHLGNYTEAIKYFDQALAIQPNDVFALSGKGYTLGNLGNYTEAIKYFDQALAIQPNDANSLGGKGMALFYLGNYTEAIKYFDQALAIQPNNVNALMGKQNALSKLSHHHIVKIYKGHRH